MHNGNNNKRRQGPPGKGMNAGEKPNNFQNAIKRLVDSLNNFKILIVF